MRNFALKRMVEAASKGSAGESSSKSPEVVINKNKWEWVTSWQQRLRWSPTSKQEIIASEKQLLTLMKAPYVQEQVDIGSGPPGSNVRWFRSASNEHRYINTVTFDQTAPPDAPTIVLVHGYGASQGFFFRNFDALATQFRVLAIDQLGWGASSRPDFTCRSTEETEAWFVDSFEEWRKAKNLDNFILLGHSLGGYVAARYALKHPEHVQHLILVGPAGFSAESDRILQFRATWRGAILNYFWDSNLTPQKVVRSLGPFGPNLVRKYTGARFGLYTTGNGLDDNEAKYLSDYIFHTLAARASGELCLKYIFSLGAFARSPLFKRAADWKVPTTFIYGVDDWMDYRAAQEARKLMNVPTELIRVPQGGHFVFLDNAPGFHSALVYACRRIDQSVLVEDLTKQVRSTLDWQHCWDKVEDGAGGEVLPYGANFGAVLLDGPKNVPPRLEANYERQETCYPNANWKQGKTRGVALIVSMESTRFGAGVDRGSLKTLADVCGFRNVLLVDRVAHDLLGIINNVAKDDVLEEDECFLCSVNGHGGTQDGEPYIMDEKGARIMVMSDIVGPFRRSKRLRGKPKVIFINCCRGEMLYVNSQTMDAESQKVEADADTQQGTGSPRPDVTSLSDCLLVFATSEGCPSCRDPVSGSIFVRHLVETVVEKRQKMDVLSMMIVVNDRVSQGQQLVEDPDTKTEVLVGQVCEYRGSLRKKLYWTDHELMGSGS